MESTTRKQERSLALLILLTLAVFYVVGWYFGWIPIDAVVVSTVVA